MALIASALLSACSGGGGGGTTPDTTGDTTPETTTGGSTSSNPAVLAIETTYKDSIAAADQLYYKFTTDDKAFSYEIDLQELSTSYIWTLYTDSGFSLTSAIDSCHQSYDTGDCETIELAPNTTYYLSLQEASGTKDDFTIRIRRVLTSEGTLSEPVELTVGTTYQGTLGEKNYSSSVLSYYKFTTNLADGPYTISLTGATTDVKWELYKGDWNSPVRDCDAIWEAGDESCTAESLSGSTVYYLGVETQGPEATLVNIDITEGGTDTTSASDEGTPEAPVTLTLEQAHKGSISPSGTSYYKFTTGDTTASHLIKLERLSTSYDLSLYTDSGFTNEIDSTPYTLGWSFSDINWRTILLDPNTTFYLKVVESSYTPRGDEYQITVSPDVVQNPDSEGTTITPIELTVGVPYTTGTVGASSSSYYQVTLPEAKPYKVSLTNSTTDLSWALYGSWDDFYSIKYCNNNTFNSGDEICDVYYPIPDAGSTVYLAVSEYDSGISGTFNLLVETIEGEGEGSPTSPVALTPGVSYLSSLSAGGISYYEFTTGPEQALYRISVTGATSDTDWEIRPVGDSNVTSTCNNYYNSTEDEICDTKLLLPNTSYLLAVSENDSLRTDITVTVEAGSAIKTLELDTPLNDTIDGYADRGYYAFTTNSVDTTYTISVTEDLTNNLNYVIWFLYSDDNYGYPAETLAHCMATATDSQNISCTVTGLNTDTTYYLQTETSGTIGVSDTYDIQVSIGDFSEGSIDSPVALTLGVEHAGSVSSWGSSYYRFTTESGGPSLVHSIDFIGDSGATINLYDDAAFSNEIDYCTDSTGTMTGCQTVSLSTGTTYYLEVHEDGGYTGNFTLTVYK